MVSGNRISAAARACMRPLHYVHARPVMLQEIEIRGGEPGQRMTEIAHRGHCLQEHFGQQHRRPDIEIDAAIVQLGHARRQQPEVAMGGAADGRGVGGRMGVARSVPMATWTVTGVLWR